MTNTTTKYNVYNIYRKLDNGKKKLEECYVTDNIHTAHDNKFWLTAVNIPAEPNYKVYDPDQYLWEIETREHRKLMEFYLNSYFYGESKDRHGNFAKLLGISRREAKNLVYMITYRGVTSYLKNNKEGYATDV